MDNLFLLVKSLGKAEKRYFKLFASKHGFDNNHLQLFDLLEKSKTYDKEKVMSQLKIASVKLFNTNKHYLSSQILKSLRSFHSERSVNIELHNSIIDIEILFNKNLFDLCEKEITRFKKIAAQHDRFDIILQLYHVEKMLVNRIPKPHKKTKELLKSIYKEENNILNKLNNLYNYRLLAAGLSGSLEINQSPTAVEKILNNKLLSDSKYALSINAKRIFHYTKSLCYYALSKWQEAYNEGEKTKILLEDNPMHLRADINIYIIILRNLLAISVFLKKEKEIINTYNTYISIPEKYKLPNKNTLSPILLLTANSYLMAFYCSTAQYEKGLKLISESNKLLDQHNDVIAFYVKSTFMYSASICFFGTKNYQQSLEWVNKIVSTAVTGKHVYEEIQMFARILKLITCYELQNYSLLLPSAINAFKYFLKTQKRTYRFEKTIIEFFNKMYSINNNKETVNSFVNLKSELTEILKDKNEANMMQYFDVIAWVESKINNRPFAEIAREKVLSN